MDENPGVEGTYRTASPWPVLIAVGLAVAEVGVVFPLYPLAVGGLLLFLGSVVGILRETGYVDDPWPALVYGGVVLIVLGTVIYRLTTGGFAVDEATLSTATGAIRGVAVVIAGTLAIVAGVSGRFVVGVRCSFLDYVVE
ncbi:cox cluster protein [Halobacteriales archaeon SW_7_68_16]|nr:MAG: cox cluster protein [Halobacteriales archaeon SW_7_68_16]